MKWFRKMLFHICLICSVVCIVAGVVDWYNPYMNFGQYFRVEKLMLGFGILILIFTNRKIRKGNGGTG